MLYYDPNIHPVFALWSDGSDVEELPEPLYTHPIRGLVEQYATEKGLPHYISEGS